MRVKPNDYVDLLKQIEIATGRTFTDAQISNILIEFNFLSNWGAAFHIAEEIEQMNSHPRNVYGLVVGKIKDAKKLIAKKTPKVTAQENLFEERGTWEEHVLQMTNIRIISRLKDSKSILEKYSQRMTQAIDNNNLTEFLRKSKEFYLQTIKDRPELLRTFVTIE